MPVMKSLEHNFKAVCYEYGVSFVHVPLFDLVLFEVIRLNPHRCDQVAPFMYDLIYRLLVQRFKGSSFPIK
jgi:hypothetical protein